MMDRPWSLISNAKEFECSKVMEYLDSYLAGELTVETNHAILRHLQRCLACTSELEAVEALREAVRRAAARVPEPSAGMEARLRILLAATPAPASRRPLMITGGILAAAALLVAGIVVVGNRDAGRFSLPLAVEERCTLVRAWPVVPPDVDELARQAGPEWAGAVRLAVPRLAGYQVLSAHECLRGGTASFHLVIRPVRDAYSKRPDYVSVVVAPRTTTTGHGSGVLSGGWARGYYVLEAPAGGEAVFVVSRGGPGETAMVSRAVLPAIRSALSAVPGHAS